MSRMNYKYVSRTPIAYIACQDILAEAIATKLVLTLNFGKLHSSITEVIQTAMERRFVACERGAAYRLWAAFAQHYDFPFVAVGRLSNVHVQEKYISEELRDVMGAYNKISKNKFRRGDKLVTDVVGGVRIVLFPKPDKMAGTAVAQLVWSKFNSYDERFDNAMLRLKADMARGSVTLLGV